MKEKLQEFWKEHTELGIFLAAMAVILIFPWFFGFLQWYMLRVEKILGV